MKKEFEVKALKNLEELNELQHPLEVYINEQQFKLAESIDKKMAIYIKPKAWYMPMFIYRLFIRNHVMITTFNNK